MVKKTTVKKKTFKPESIIIDALNTQLIYYSKPGFKGSSRFVKVRGEKSLYKKAFEMGMKKGIEVFDRFSRTNLNFRKVLRI